jgi:hypothetical protein
MSQLTSVFPTQIQRELEVRQNLETPGSSNQL